MKSLSRTLLSVFVLLAPMGVSSCTQQTETSPSIWIDSPMDGDPMPSGVTVTVSSHAYARQGVAEVVLSINGESHRRDAPSGLVCAFELLNQHEWRSRRRR